ncbi:MAG TPA: alpha/beta fold hydrolase [Candidatus Limnocylindrales bacterium]
MDPAKETPRLAPDQSRARYPDRTGFIEREGVHSFWEVYGEGEPAILFAPTWSIVHSRIWKAQIPYFARRHRVITVDSRGNGRSDRPLRADAYAEREMAADLLATMDATGTDVAVIVSLSLGAQRALILAAEHPERVAGLVFLGPSVPLGNGPPGRDISFDERLDTDEGWARYNRHFWRRDYRAFLEFFFTRCFTEPHSTKQIEDAVGWGGDTDPETLILTADAEGLEEDAARHLCAGIRCPTLVIQGDDDAITGPGRGVALAQAITGARLATIAGGGHILNARDPVRVNLLIRDFVRSVTEAAVA